MPSADLTAAIETAVKARVVNSGQSCIAAKRFIVRRGRRGRVRARLHREDAGAQGRRSDGSRDRGGPAGDERARSRDLDDQVRRSIAAGARVLAGGQPARAARELLRADGARGYPNPARRRTQRSCSGRSRRCSVCATPARRSASPTDTRLVSARACGRNDAAERARFIDEIEAGQVFVNGMVVSDPRLPFGGIKNSGYGRELGVYGIREFVNVKTVWIKRRSRRASREPDRIESGDSRTGPITDGCGRLSTLSSAFSNCDRPPQFAERTGQEVAMAVTNRCAGHSVSPRRPC